MHVHILCFEGRPWPNRYTNKDVLLKNKQCQSEHFEKTDRRTDRQTDRQT